MKYEKILLTDVDTLKQNLNSPNLEVKSKALLQLFMNDIDLDLATLWIEKCLQDKNIDILRLGILGISHVIRVYSHADASKLKNLLNTIQCQELQGVIEDARDDLEIYGK